MRFLIHASGRVETANDGLLQLDEILGLNLRADWAVLSACNTGAAEGLGAEAVSGLGRAFFFAGAKALLVSHWPVHSHATEMLTTRLFAAEAATPGQAGSSSLQRARMELVDSGYYSDGAGRKIFSYAHPLFWAPFTLVGKGRSR
ncbi:MAG: CHAT domain-containing protein [Gammaproteobacteria bacterium]|jgi:CHAT domain-containing protein